MKGIFLKADWSPKKDYFLSDYEKETHKALFSNKVWKNPKLSIRDIEKPKINPNEVLIKVRACGICGSDLHYVESDEDGYIIYPGHTKLNIVLGHEFAGVVEEVGENVKKIKVGDYVCAEEMQWCGECISCKNGFPNQCENLEEIGVTKNGGMAEYVSVPAKLCWSINEFKKVFENEQDIFNVGALIEPTSVAYNAIFERGQGFRPGAFVVISGCGPIGLLATALSKAAGAAKVIAFDFNKSRRKIAKDMGADYILDPKEVDYCKVVKDLTNGRGADVLIEASGSINETLNQMIKCIAVNGKIIQTAMTSQTANLNFVNLQSRAGQIYGTIGHSGNGTFENVIRLIASKRINLNPIISNVFSLSEFDEAFAYASKRDSGKIIFNI